jgi:hypothetical protein
MRSRRRVEKKNHQCFPLFSRAARSSPAVIGALYEPSVTYAICVSRADSHGMIGNARWHCTWRRDFVCMHHRAASAALIMIMDERTQTVRLIQSRASLWSAYFFTRRDKHTSASCDINFTVAHISPLAMGHDTCFRKHNENECVVKITWKCRCIRAGGDCEPDPAQVHSPESAAAIYPSMYVRRQLLRALCPYASIMHSLGVGSAESCLLSDMWLLFSSLSWT